MHSGVKLCDIVRHMGRIQLEDFTDKTISLIFIAANVVQAERVEDILTRKGIDYAIVMEPYRRIGLISTSELNGIAFYILSGQAQYCIHLLESEGLSSGLTLEQ